MVFSPYDSFWADFYICYKLRVEYHCFPCGYPVVPASYVEKNILFPTEWSCTACQKLIDYRYMSSFLDLILFCILYVNCCQYYTILISVAMKPKCGCLNLLSREIKKWSRGQNSGTKVYWEKPIWLCSFPQCPQLHTKFWNHEVWILLICSSFSRLLSLQLSMNFRINLSNSAKQELKFW